MVLRTKALAPYSTQDDVGKALIPDRYQITTFVREIRVLIVDLVLLALAKCPWGKLCKFEVAAPTVFGCSDIVWIQQKRAIQIGFESILFSKLGVRKLYSGEAIRLVYDETNFINWNEPTNALQQLVAEFLAALGGQQLSNRCAYFCNRCHGHSIPFSNEL